MITRIQYYTLELSDQHSPNKDETGLVYLSTAV